LAVNAIEETGPAPANFLEHPTTLENFRTVAWYPDLFEHTTLRQWENQGRPELIGRAREIAKERIAAHEYRLDAGKRRELDTIYARAEKECT
jgi:trimethylamine:corrinoid methyltransferase-like protein